MTEPRALYYIFSELLDEASRQKILEEANIKDDRPSILRGQGGSPREGISWMQSHRTRIVPLIFRFIDPPDRLVFGLVNEEDLHPPFIKKSKPMELSFSQLTESSYDTEEYTTELPVLDIALTSAFISEIFVDIARANKVCGFEVIPPKATIKSGSVKYTLGGGLFASGMGLLVACGAGLVGAPIVGPVAGVTLATVGIFDLALGWRKIMAETTKIKKESRKTDEDTRLVELEVKIKQLELEKAQLLNETQPEYAPHRGVYVRRSVEEHQSTLLPESAEVRRKIVRRTAENLNMSEAYANHMLNRCLGKFRTLKQKIAGANLTSSDIKG